MTQEAMFQDLKVFIEEKIDELKQTMATKKSLDELKKTMATQESVDEIMIFLNDTVATKEDLEGFATKEDLKAFATKEDLKVFATKEDLEAFATKEDLANFELSMQNEFTDVRSSISELDRKIDDSTAALRKDMVAIKRMVSEDVTAFGLDVVDHERRIARLEKMQA